MSSPRRRIEHDVMKLLMSHHEATLAGDNMNEIYVKFKGPKETCYERGEWKIHVELPENYPYKSPSIGFQTKIFHPNIDEMSGSVCLDVINQTWTPMYELLNVFDIFLPQLLTYPNASDPLNGEAATMWSKDRKMFDAKVNEYIDRYATSQALNEDSSEAEGGSSPSSVGSFGSVDGDDQPAGQMDDV